MPLRVSTAMQPVQSGGSLQSADGDCADVPARWWTPVCLTAMACCVLVGRARGAPAMRARRRFTVAEFPVDACTFMHPPHTEHITKYINAVWRPKSALWYMTPSLPSLLLLLLPAAVASRSDPRETECSSLIKTVPAVTDHVMPMDSQPAATASLSTGTAAAVEAYAG